MGHEGFNLIHTNKDASWARYEDLQSLKKFLWANSDKSSRRSYERDKLYEIFSHLTQTSTGTQAELESTDSIAIAQIGRTGVLLELAAAADDASHNGIVFTITWKDEFGNTYISEATGTAGLATTPVAFATPVTTAVYEVISFVASADFDNQDVYAMINGGVVYATITAAGTVLEATDDQMIGVGTMYGRTHTNHNDGDGDVLHMDYFTPWGDFIKNATCTIDTTTGTIEIRFIKTTTAGVLQTLVNGVAIAASRNANDIWYIVDLWTNSAPTANTHEHLVCDDDCANVDGSGGDVYGVIKELEFSGTFTRFRVPTGFDGWVAEVEWLSPEVTAAGDDVKFIQSFFPDGYSIRKIHSHNFRNEHKESHPLKLEEEKDYYVTMADIGNAMEVSYDAHYILAKRNTIT